MQLPVDALGVGLEVLGVDVRGVEVLSVELLGVEAFQIKIRPTTRASNKRTPTSNAPIHLLLRGSDTLGSVAVYWPLELPNSGTTRRLPDPTMRTGRLLSGYLDSTLATEFQGRLTTFF